MLITHGATKAALDICEELRRTTLNHHTDFLTASLICSLIDYAAKCIKQSTLSGIDTALEHVKYHYTEEITIDELCEMSYLSPAQFFRLFKQKTGMSPVEYKNFLRIKKAESLLCDPYCSISEVADILGFENACYFTRIFKKFKGISPSEYKKTNSS